MSGQMEKSRSGVAPPSQEAAACLNSPFAAAPTELKLIDRMILGITPRAAYLEIGSFRGGSLRRFGSLMDDGAKVVAVDRPMSKPGVVEELHSTVLDLRAKGFDTDWIEGDSHDFGTIMEVKRLAPFDILLIDGDHSPAGVMADVFNYVPLVRSGGLVIFHDVGPCPWTRESAQCVIDACFEAWKSVAQQNRHKMIIQSNAGYGLVWIN